VQATTTAIEQLKEETAAIRLEGLSQLQIQTKGDTMAKKSVSRPSVLEIATDPTLADREEPVDSTLKPLELQPYYSKTELSDDIKSKWDRLIIQLLDTEDPIYFKIKTKREYIAATT